MMIFPRWNGGHDEAAEYKREALGMEILAHHYRVGFAEVIGSNVALTSNDKKLWVDGKWSGTAAGVLNSKDQVGSSKARDGAKL